MKQHHFRMTPAIQKSVDDASGDTFYMPSGIKPSQGFSSADPPAPRVFPILCEGEHHCQRKGQGHTGLRCSTASNYHKDAAQSPADHGVEMAARQGQGGRGQGEHDPSDATLKCTDKEERVTIEMPQTSAYYGVEMDFCQGQNGTGQGKNDDDSVAALGLGCIPFLLLSIVVFAIVSFWLRVKSHTSPSISEPGRVITKNNILKTSGIRRFDELVLVTLIMLAVAPRAHAEKRQPFQPGNQIMSGTFPSQGDEIQASVRAGSMLYTHTGSELHVYDIEDNRWTEIPSLGPGNRRGHRIQWSHVDQNVYLTGGFYVSDTFLLNPSFHKYTTPGTIKKNVIDIWHFSGATLEFKDLTQKALANAGIFSPAQVQGTETFENNLVPHFRWNFGWAYSGVPGKMLLFGGFYSHFIYNYFCKFLASSPCTSNSDDLFLLLNARPIYGLSSLGLVEL